MFLNIIYRYNINPNDEKDMFYKSKQFSSKALVKNQFSCYLQKL